MNSWLSLVAGVVLSVLAGLFGAWIQSRNEHSKWLRERRYEVYRAFIAAADYYLLASSPQSLIKVTDQEFSRDFMEKAGAVTMIGPNSVEDASSHVRAKVMEAWMNPKERIDTAAYSVVRLKFLKEVRSAIGIEAPKN